MSTVKVFLSSRLGRRTLVSALVFALAAVAPTMAQQVSRGPYLQMATPDSVTILWSTDQLTDSRVTYGPRLDTLTSSVEDLALRTDHALTLSGLKAGSLHYYTVGTTTGILAGGDAQHVFTTSPVVGSARQTRIWALGDSGQGGISAEQVRDAYYAASGSQSTDLLLMLGDNAYPTGTQSDYQQKLFDVYSDICVTTPIWTTIGNHDSFDGPNKTWPYFDIFMLPQGGEAGGVASGTEAYYSFDHANVHFVVLDSTTYPGGGLLQSPMLPWLEADLASTTQPWIVAFFHHPPYSKGSHNSDNPADSNGRLVDMREHVVPILENHGVDLVMSGHSHSYERSYLIHGHYEDSSTWVEAMKVDGGDGAADGDGAYDAEGDGTVYTVAGSSSKLSPGSFDHPAMLVGDDLLGSVILGVSGNRLDAEFLDNNGQSFDHFTLTKGGCNDNGLCETGEDCFVCPGDCSQVPDTRCGNGVCEILAGEDCDSCPDDCNGKRNGRPSGRWCCGDGDGQNPVPFTDPRCSTDGYWITDVATDPACCGDAVCSGAEDAEGCAVDCGGGSGGDPGDPPDPPTCEPVGASCTEAAECCSNKCKGKPGAKTCK